MNWLLWNHGLEYKSPPSPGLVFSLFKGTRTPKSAVSLSPTFPVSETPFPSLQQTSRKGTLSRALSHPAVTKGNQKLPRGHSPLPTASLISSKIGHFASVKFYFFRLDPEANVREAAVARCDIRARGARVECERSFTEQRPERRRPGHRGGGTGTPAFVTFWSGHPEQTQPLF